MFTQTGKITQRITSRRGLWLLTDNTFLTRAAAQLEHLFPVCKPTQTDDGVARKMISYFKSSQWKSWEKYIFLSGPCGCDMKPYPRLSDQIWPSSVFSEEIIMCNNNGKILYFLSGSLSVISVSLLSLLVSLSSAFYGNLLPKKGPEKFIFVSHNNVMRFVFHHK